MYRSQSLIKGFTLVELLVVIAIIGILSSMVYVSFGQARAQTRDDIRQSDLKQLQLAIELYKAQNGVYPSRGCGATNWVGPGPGSTYSACTEYIEGLVPDYISQLPVDPRQGDENDHGYLYNTNADDTAYKLIAWRSVEAKFVTDFNHPFVRCPQDYGTTWCGGTPQANTYAVYSPGAEDF